MEEFEFQYYTPAQFHHNILQNSTPNGSQAQASAQFVQFNQQQKANDSRCNTNNNKNGGGGGSGGANNGGNAATQSMVYSMDRLSPYGNYQDDTRSNNLSNLTLDQIFKSNQNDDQSNLVVVNSNESMLIYQQQQQNQQQQQQNQQQTQQTNTSASPSNTSMSSSSSPQSSSSPSSTNDTNSNYVEGLQLLDCGMAQQQGQLQHHQGPTLVSLVPPSASTLNPLLNPMMNIISPSKPTNISELSNSSMVSSSSSSTLDSNQFRSSVQSQSRARTRNQNSKTSNDQHQKDGKYFERRKRNNVAAKKSRDARKQREDEIAIRASFLEKENSILKAQLQTLKDEAQQLRILLTQKKASQSMSGLMAPSCANCSNCMSKQMNTNAYVPTLTSLQTAYDNEPTINLVDQKLSNQSNQTSAQNTQTLYLAQPHQSQQLNRLL